VYGRATGHRDSAESLSINPDGSVAYVKTDPGPEPVLFSEDRELLDTVNASPDDFDAEAEAIELGAGAARPLSHEQFLDGERAASTKVAAAARERAVAEGQRAKPTGRRPTRMSAPTHWRRPNWSRGTGPRRRVKPAIAPAPPKPPSLPRGYTSG